MIGIVFMTPFCIHKYVSSCHVFWVVQKNSDSGQDAAEKDNVGGEKHDMRWQDWDLEHRDSERLHAAPSDYA